MGAAKWSTQFLSWASTILVARLLTPGDYGLVTLAGVYLGLVALIGEFGIGTTILTMKDPEGGQLARFNALACTLGAASFCLTFLTAWPLGRFFRSDNLPLVVIVLSLTFLVNGFQVVPGAVLRRELRFRTLAMIDVARGISIPIGTYLLALMGFRYWALVAAAVASTVLSTGLTLWSKRVPFIFSGFGSLSGIRMSFEILVTRCGWFVYSESDFAVAGRRLGEQAVGAYSLAWTLANSPIDRLSAFFTDVVPSIFAAAQHDTAALRRYFMNMTELVGMVTTPVAFGISLVSMEFVSVVLGSKWEGVGEILTILAAYAAVRAITPLFGYLVPVTGQTRFGMKVGVATAIALPLAFVAGSRWGPVGIAWAWLTVHPIMTVVLYRRLQQVVGWRSADYLKALRVGLDGSIAMVVVVVVLRQIAPMPSHVSQLIFDVIVGAVVFTSVTLLLHRRRLADMRAWLTRVRSG